MMCSICRMCRMCSLDDGTSTLDLDLRSMTPQTLILLPICLLACVKEKIKRRRKLVRKLIES